MEGDHGRSVNNDGIFSDATESQNRAHVGRLYHEGVQENDNDSNGERQQAHPSSSVSENPSENAASLPPGSRDPQTIFVGHLDEYNSPEGIGLTDPLLGPEDQAMGGEIREDWLHDEQYNEDRLIGRFVSSGNTAWTSSLETFASIRGHAPWRGLGAGCFFLFLAIAAVVAFVRSPTASNTNERLEEVLTCASRHSGFDINENDNPHQWKAVQYLVNGGGKYVNTDDCHEKDALFSSVYSLIVLRESLSIDNPTWYAERSFVKSIGDLCRWKRVGCGIASKDTGSLAITHIMLNHANLTGTIPSEIQGLWRLEFLDLNTNAGLSGSLQSDLGLLPYLQSLLVHNTNLEGTLSTSFGQLTRLHQFVLHDTKITGQMPVEVCALFANGDLRDLRANCDGQPYSVQCSCCTRCK